MDRVTRFQKSSDKIDAIPANTGHSSNAVSMLGQRRRRCANIETALGECPVFAGMGLYRLLLCTASMQ